MMGKEMYGAKLQVEVPNKNIIIKFFAKFIPRFRNWKDVVGVTEIKTYKKEEQK